MNKLKLWLDTGKALVHGLTNPMHETLAIDHINERAVLTCGCGAKYNIAKAGWISR